MAETDNPRSRRTLLGSGLGAVIAAIAAGLSRGQSARAADGQPMTLGSENHASRTTSITIDDEEAPGVVFSASRGGFGAGLAGLSLEGRGVEGTSTAGTGVYAHSQRGAGVLAESVESDGIQAIATKGRAVYAVSESGAGVSAYSTSGPGVFATSKSGFALRTIGRLRLSTSGSVTIRAGTSSTTLDPHVDVSATSFVLLTPQANIGTRALWYMVDVARGTFTVHISSSRTSDAEVAWLLLG